MSTVADKQQIFNSGQCCSVLIGQSPGVVGCGDKSEETGISCQAFEDPGLCLEGKWLPASWSLPGTHRDDYRYPH